MKKTNENLYLLIAIFSSLLVLANVLTVKATYVGEWRDITITCTGAVLTYGMTYLITDTIGEIWGKPQAKLCIRVAFVCQIIATCFIFVVGKFPALDPEVSHAFDIILGQNWTFVIASLTAYIVSQNLDIYVFHRIRDKLGSRHKWFRNGLTTAVSQFIDTCIFMTVGYGLGLGWLFDGRIGLIGGLICGDYMIKAILVICGIPLFYILTGSLKFRKKESTA